MKQVIVYIICIVCLVSSGCVIIAGTPTIHPHSEVTEPTFCLHGGKSEPRAITEIAVIRGKKVNDERIEWVESGPWKGDEQVAWVLEYAIDGSDSFSCITYGKAPPGYMERSPALPLTPERLYRVVIWNEDASHPTDMYFIIRLDPMGKPVKLEYARLYTNSLNVRVITR